MRSKPYYYKQTDPRWRWVMYSRKGINDPSQTIGSSGCGPTCAAMVIRTLRGLDVTPVNTCDWSVAHGYRTIENGTDWAYFIPQLAQYGIKAHQTMDAAETVNALKDGKMVIGRATAGLWTKDGHFILAWKVEGDKIHINDPNSELQRKTVAPLATWKKECWPFWIIDETEDPPKMTGKEIDAALTEYRATLPADTYAAGACKKAVACGLFADGNNDGTVDNPRGNLQRQELVAILDRLGLLDDGAIAKLKRLLSSM